MALMSGLQRGSLLICRNTRNVCIYVYEDVVSEAPRDQYTSSLLPSILHNQGTSLISILHNQDTSLISILHKSGHLTNQYTP